jgi:hydrogenase-4 component F
MGIILVAAGISGEAAHLGAAYQIMTHAVTKSFCFFAAGSALLITKTRYIASIRGLIRISPIAGISLLIGGLAIAGAPPFAVFVSEFSIFKAGIADGQYMIIGLLIFFIVIAFWGIINQVNKMVFGKAFDSQGRSALPLSCIVALTLAVIPVMVFGLFIPEPLHNLLRFAATAFGR